MDAYLTSAELYILQTLAYQPWLTSELLADWLARSVSRTHASLQQLLQKRLVQQVRPRSASLSTRSVYALSDRGLRVLAERAQVDVATYVA